MPAQRIVHPRRGERRDTLLEVDVPGEGPVDEQVGREAAGDAPVLRARHGARFEESLLRGLDLGIGEALGQRALQLFADRALDALAVLRRVDR